MTPIEILVYYNHVLEACYSIEGKTGQCCHLLCILRAFKGLKHNDQALPVAIQFVFFLTYINAVYQC